MKLLTFNGNYGLSCSVSDILALVHILRHQNIFKQCCE